MDYKFIVSSIIRTQFLDSHAFLFRKWSLCLQLDKSI
jgi:hypothetical protein